MTYSIIYKVVLGRDFTPRGDSLEEKERRPVP
jgi:hypothetical protein